MQKINLSLTNVTAIQVTKALRAVKGDYILVEADGATSVVSPAVFRAMTVLQDHTGHAVPQPYRTKEQGSDLVWPQIKAALEKHGALTTSQLAQIVEVPWKETLAEKRTYINGICRGKKGHVLEAIIVDAPNVRGDVRSVSLWDFKKQESYTNGTSKYNLAQGARGLSDG